MGVSNVFRSDDLHRHLVSDDRIWIGGLTEDISVPGVRPGPRGRRRVGPESPPRGSRRSDHRGRRDAVPRGGPRLARARRPGSLWGPVAGVDGLDSGFRDSKLVKPAPDVDKGFVQERLCVAVRSENLFISHIYEEEEENTRPAAFYPT